jgi:hypothetical protein
MVEQPSDVKPKRPLGVYVMTLWSVARGATALLTLVGIYRIYSQVSLVLDDHDSILNNFIRMWESEFAIGQKVSIIISVVEIYAFLILALGILFGKNWGRLGYIWTSIAVVISNLLPLAFYGRLTLAPLIYSLIPLLFATWYFRRPNVLAFYQAEDNSPKWSKLRWGKVPADLALALVLIVFMAVNETLAFVRVLQYLHG